MRICTIDLETFWSPTHSLTKMSPIAYCTHPETEVISCAIKFNNYPTDVFFGEATVKQALSKLDWSNTMVIGHNLSAFDVMILRWRLGVNPKMWGCTLAMARPIHAKTTGLSLAKLVAHYCLGVKDSTALMDTKGRHLKDFTAAEREAMAIYNKADVEQCYALFKKLRPHFSGKELWQIDNTIRMLVEPQFVVNTNLLDTALIGERNRKSASVMTLAEMLDIDIDIHGDTGAIEEILTTQLASAAKFSMILTNQNVPVPTKPSPSNPEKTVPALAKSDQAFLDLQEHGNPVVAAAARARLAVKSTILETRIMSFLAAAQVTGGLLPIPINYCGADTTGRQSGFLYNPQNLPRIGAKPQLTDALRNCMEAPPGHKVVVADLSGIELRVNMFLWKVPYAMKLFQDSPDKADLYKTLAAEVLGVPYDELTKMQRAAGKAMHLGCGFGLGNAKKYVAVAKVLAQIDVSEEDAVEHIAGYRRSHPEIVQGWKTCGTRIRDIYDGVEAPIDPWGMCVTSEHGIKLPSGRYIRYPNLRMEEGGTWPDGRSKQSWVYGEGRHKAFLNGPKTDENLAQALARDVISDNAFQVYQLTGYRPKLMVHDELVYIVPDSEADHILETVQSVMRTPPQWWPELITWSEGDIAQSYGAAK